MNAHPGVSFAQPLGMRSWSSATTIRRKATWGAKAALASLLLLILALVGTRPVEAQTTVNASETGAKAKLDREVRAKAEGGQGESTVIVEFTDPRDDSDVLYGFGVKGKRLGIINGRVLRIPNNLLEKLAEHPRVKRIHHDRPVTGHVARTAITIGSRTVVALMGYTGAGVGVAVIDSGITNWHDDLRINGYGESQPSLLTLATTSLSKTGLLLNTNQRVAHFKDFVGGLSTPYDDWGHGTHVSGIIAGNGYDSVGIREGIAPGAHIISLKALDAQGAGTISNVIAAIEYAIVNKAALNIRVLNMSLGAAVHESYHTDPLTQAAKRAVEAGIVVVASAGNMGRAPDGSAQYGAIGAPGNAPWVLTVGASSTEGTVWRSDDVLAPYSSRGPTMYDYSAKPDLVAPGTGTVSLSSRESTMYTQKSSFLVGGLLNVGYKPYLTLSGTSMAAPVVSGTVALMLHANPNLTPNMVKAILQFTSQVYPGYDYLSQGAGFLNARSAVVLAEYFATGKPGMAYPSMRGWARHIIWGNYRVSGGVLAPNGTAWATNIVWGDTRTPNGMNIVWGDNCDTFACDNIVWGNNIVWGDDGAENIVWGQTENIVWGQTENIVWGQTDGDNIVWGNGDGDNVVWGNGELDNIVWGQSFDNIVWGNDCGGEDCHNIVWGQFADNIVWGNAEGIENIVWGQSFDNIVWGNSTEDETFPDETVEVESFDPTVWDELFEYAVPATPLAPALTTTTSLLGGGL